MFPNLGKITGISQYGNLKFFLCTQLIIAGTLFATSYLETIVLASDVTLETIIYCFASARNTFVLLNLFKNSFT